MTVEVVHFPAGIYPSVQRLVPDMGDGQQVLGSPFIGAHTVQTWRGADRWRLEMQFDDLTGADRAEMMAFVTRLRVSHNVFLVVNHTANNRGSLGGSMVVNSATAGQWLIVEGATGNVTSWAFPGDFISVNSQLKMVIAQPAATSPGGTGSLQVWPPFYSIPSSGTPVVVSSACGGFRMLQASQLTTDPPGYRTSLAITAVERVNSSMVSEFL